MAGATTTGSKKGKPASAKGKAGASKARTGAPRPAAARAAQKGGRPAARTPAKAAKPKMPAARKTAPEGAGAARPPAAKANPAKTKASKAKPGKSKPAGGTPAGTKRATAAPARPAAKPVAARPAARPPTRKAPAIRAKAASAGNGKALQLNRLHQIALLAHDLDRAVDFYRDVLGLTFIDRFDPPGLAFFNLGGGLRLLLSATASEATLYFRVDDIDEAVAAFAGRGVSFLQKPHMIHRDDAGAFGKKGTEEWMAFFRDPSGNLLALVAQR